MAGVRMPGSPRGSADIDALTDLLRAAEAALAIERGHRDAAEAYADSLARQWNGIERRSGKSFADWTGIDRRKA